LILAIDVKNRQICLGGSSIVYTSAEFLSHCEVQTAIGAVISARGAFHSAIGALITARGAFHSTLGAVITARGAFHSALGALITAPRPFISVRGAIERCWA
jgi:hypothetical protein